MARKVLPKNISLYKQFQVGLLAYLLYYLGVLVFWGVLQ
jgi:hypothetical protein